MKMSNVLNSIALSAAAITLTGLLGCATGSSGSDTAAGLTQSASKIEAGKGKIDAVLTNLNDMAANPNSDLTPKFKAFNSALADLESTGKHVTAKVEAMRAKGEEYFKAWDQQLATIHNEDIKTRSAERKASVQARFADIKKSYSDAQVAFKPFMQDLKDIQTALKADLTAGGIGAIQGPVAKANKDAVPLKTVVDKLILQFRELGVAMAAAPQPPPK